VEAVHREDFSRVFLRNYERALMAELRHELRRGLDIHRAFVRLPNARVDRLLSILARDALRGTILRWGDIDYPSPAFYKSLKRAPPLSCLRPLATQVSSCLAAVAPEAASLGLLHGIKRKTVPSRLPCARWGNRGVPDFGFRAGWNSNP
jgi:hypothetical protein